MCNLRMFFSSIHIWKTSKQKNTLYAPRSAKHFCAFFFWVVRISKRTPCAQYVFPLKTIGCLSVAFMMCKLVHILLAKIHLKNVVCFLGPCFFLFFACKVQYGLGMAFSHMLLYREKKTWKICAHTQKKCHKKLCEEGLNQLKSYKSQMCTLQEKFETACHCSTIACFSIHYVFYTTDWIVLQGIL